MLLRKDFSILFVLWSCFLVTSQVNAADKFEAFLTRYCVDCHGPDKEKGDLRLDKLSREF